MFSVAKLPKKVKNRFPAVNFFPSESAAARVSAVGFRRRCGAGRQRPVPVARVSETRFQRPGFEDGTGSGDDAELRRCWSCPGSTFACNHTRVRPGAAVGAGSVSCREQKRSTPGISRGACVPAAVGSSELPAQRVPWCLIWRPACCSVRRRCAAAWRQRASQRPCIRQRPSSSPYRQPGSL